ncbi:nucleoside deaminase [Desulfuromonas sp. TF]|uniref:nucleoside deaminase n=1 Tax=Desulfuromonas sp. TF TaxID=1232410 RepID=UPI000684F7D1|nr:nucleoside deaminase [Desulfuromonas sp. TF]
MDEYMRAALEEAKAGLAEGGIPVGSVLVHNGQIIGRGRNRRVQCGSAILHGETDAIESADRQPAAIYRQCTIYTTLSPCAMCSEAILLFGTVSSAEMRPNSRFVCLQNSSDPKPLCIWLIFAVVGLVASILRR